ncbi:hypothetical protein [Arthrobacter pigmenti]
MSRSIDFDRTGQWRRRTVVHISGPKHARRQASTILLDGGLACAPYGDHDQWSR